MIKKSILNMLRSNGCTSGFAAHFLLQGRSSYLKEVGWYNSFNKHMPVDRNGEAVPWYTYAAIDFLGGRINGRMAVFEYGSGNSTIWWAKRVSRVVSFEHDEQWFTKVKLKLPDNVTYRYSNLAPQGDYSTAILQHDKEFDVIVIDGRDRVSCAKNSLCALNDSGVIIWDNSDRDKYQDGYKFLSDNGFKRLDFSGFGPINTYGWCTSVFYRPQNCLGI
jgi:uncharacterized protein YuzB (UPF0349 family)